MQIVRHAKQAAAALTAFAGLSLSSAYTAPNYVPPALSPIDATTLNSTSVQLNNFNTYLGAIDAQLGAKTLAFPNAAETLPTDLEFYAAVAAAVAAAPANAEQIVSAAIQYKPTKTKDIIKAVVLQTPASAEAAVSGAAHAVPTRAADAAAGAILALITTAGTPPDDLGDAAAEAVIADTRELIEKVAKAAVASTKNLFKESTAAQGAGALAVAEALVEAYAADVAATGSNARLFADDIGRGIVAAVNGFVGTTRAAVAGAVFTKLAQAPGTSADQAVNFAMGALKSAKILVPDSAEYDAVLVALQSAAAPLTGALQDVDDAITAGAKAQKVIRSVPSGSLIGDFEVAFKASLTGTEAPHVGAYVAGAVQALKGKASDLAKWALQDPDSGVLSAAAKKSVVAAAVTGNSGQTGKIVTAAITVTGGNSVTPSEAVTAAIPAATNLYSGAAVTAALKTIPALNPATESQAVLQAAIDAAVGASYHASLGDIVLSSVKVKKAYDNELVTTAILGVPAGWEEAAAAVVLANNPKDKPDGASQTNKQAAIAAATTKSLTVPTVSIPSITLAMDLAISGKAAPKMLFDNAIEEAYDHPDLARAILFGAGAVNNKLASPLLGMLLRLKSGGDAPEVLRDYSFSLNKKGKQGLNLAYEAAVDAINYPDNIFDLVDHKVLTNPKQALEILSAVVAARPEYAHYAARAAAFRAPSAVGKTATAAIHFAHMRSNRTAAGDPATQIDDPAAVAAISAAVVLGVKDARLTPLKEIAAIKAAVAGLVKASLSFQNADVAFKKDGLIGNSANFQQATGTGDSTDDVGASVITRAKGTAGVLTGAVAQLQVDDPATPVNDLTLLNPLAKVAITAAAKAAKAHSLALAQAAGAAAAAAAAGAVGGPVVFSDFAAIASAFQGILGIPDATALENAARFGADQFSENVYGAGAAGILNYSHRSGGGTWISDISNF